MEVLTHGSDLTLAPTIRPIVDQSSQPIREALSQLAGHGFEAVQLDATMRGIRPRDLDHGARRDLTNVLTRQSVRFGGLDLLIPRRHFTDDEHVDRATAAALAAIRLAADLGRAPVSLALPVRDLQPDLRAALVDAADAHGVRLAIHAEDQLDELLAWANEVDLPALGVGLDPVALLARGLDPSDAVARCGRHLAAARLSDTAGSDADDAAMGMRRPVGEGELDVASYRVALDLAQDRSGPVVLDLRGLENPAAAAASAQGAWDNAAFKL